MRKKWILPVILALGLGLIAQASFAGSDRNSTVLKFKTMAGVVAPYTGPANAIRGSPGGGVPWNIDEAHGTLNENGDLDVEVRGSSSSRPGRIRFPRSARWLAVSR